MLLLRYRRLSLPLFQQIHLTTTISTTQTFQIFSIFGSVPIYDTFILICLSQCLFQRLKNLWLPRYRFGGNRSKAEEHFLTGLGKAFQLMKARAHPDYPLTIYYAFKQSETDNKDGGVSSTGWETMLEGLLKAGFQVTGTLPMRNRNEESSNCDGNECPCFVYCSCLPPEAQ